MPTGEVQTLAVCSDISGLRPFVGVAEIPVGIFDMLLFLFVRVFFEGVANVGIAGGVLVRDVLDLVGLEHRTLRVSTKIPPDSVIPFTLQFFYVSRSNYVSVVALFCASIFIDTVSAVSGQKNFRNWIILLDYKRIG